jgi:hypothetical protein
MEIPVKRLLAGFAASILSSFVFASVVYAQALITGENGGKGAHAVMISANAIQPKDYGTLANIWVQYGYGVSNRFDAFVNYGNITVYGRSQSYLAAGSNLGLLRRKRAGVDVALYNNASVAITHREEACRVLLLSALIASRPVKIGGYTLTPYGGVMRLTPIGAVPNPTFTPPSGVYNGIAGVALPLGKVILFLEYNPGRIQHSGGMGVLYVFPPPSPPVAKILSDVQSDGLPGGISR